MNKIIACIVCALVAMNIPQRALATLSVPVCQVSADTAFVHDTARVVSTRLCDGALVADTSLMVSTRYEVRPALRTEAPAVAPEVSDTLAVRNVSGLGMPDTLLVEWSDSIVLTLQFPLTVSKREERLLPLVYSLIVWRERYNVAPGRGVPR